MIGSMKPTSGLVKLFGEEITAMKERELERVRLRFGMLFQSGALLASLTVGENVALPILQHTDKSPDEIEQIVKQKLEMVGLTGFEDLKPDEISGGMKKRVGLARALALDPDARIVCLGDAYDAMATDRPYKKGKTLSEAIAIMGRMCREHHIDAQLFELFLASGVYRRYAEQYLQPQQIDEAQAQSGCPKLEETPSIDACKGGGVSTTSSL
jgi:ABC-type molybdate transport system ATPase subunit